MPKQRTILRAVCLLLAACMTAGVTNLTARAEGEAGGADGAPPDVTSELRIASGTVESGNVYGDVTVTGEGRAVIVGSYRGEEVSAATGSVTGTDLGLTAAQADAKARGAARS